MLTLLILSAPVGCAAGERVNPGAVAIAAPESLPEDKEIRVSAVEVIGSGADAGDGLGDGSDDEWIIFDPDTIEPVAIDMELLRGSSWEGYAMVDP